MKKTLKTAIAELISSKQGTIRLNNISSLHRWITTDGLGGEFDGLEIRFDTLNGVCVKSCFAVRIESREYAGIIDECNKAIQTFLNEAANQITNDLKAGYWNKN